MHAEVGEKQLEGLQEKKGNKIWQINLKVEDFPRSWLTVILYIYIYSDIFFVCLPMPFLQRKYHTTRELVLFTTRWIPKA